MADPALLEQCRPILEEIKGRPEAEAFQQPVPWREWNLEDYPKIIHQPMDLGTVTTHLLNGDYKDVYEFAYDMRLIWRNCCTYNQEGSEVYLVGKKLSDLFEERFAKIEEQIPEEQREPSLDMKRSFVDALFKLTPSDLAKVIQTLNERCEACLDKTNPELVDIIVDAIDNTTFGLVNTFVQSCVNKSDMEVEKAYHCLIQTFYMYLCSTRHFLT